MKATLSVALLAIAIFNYVRSDTVQLPVYGSGAFYYEHYAHDSNPEDPRFCDPWQATYNRSQCFNLVEYLTVPVGIGTPAQMLNLTLDDYIFDVTVFSEGAVDTACSGRAADGRPIVGRHLFQYSRSTTFRGSRVTKIDADNDRYFQVAGKSAQKVPFLVAKTVQSTLQSFWPSDGVLSVSVPWTGKNKSAVYQIASSVGQPQTTLYMKRTSGYSRGDRVGTLTFGGRDTKNCDKTWIDLPQGSQYWIVFNTRVNSVSLGSTEVYKNFSVASFGASSSTIGVPFSMFPMIGSMLNATFDPKTQFYVVPCDSVKDAPPLTFHMEGVDYVIPAGDYIRNLVPRSDNMCTVLMDSYGITEDWPNGQKVEEWILGMPATRSFCWNFDFDANTVSLAKAIQDF